MWAENISWKLLKNQILMDWTNRGPEVITKLSKVLISNRCKLLVRSRGFLTVNYLRLSYYCIRRCPVPPI